MSAKVIKFYRQSQWGVTREFVAPPSAGDGKIISQLTGKKTITPAVRELIRDLSAGSIQFEEVIAP
jgi:hypothetical protein